jgi:hypothetical protein
LRGACCHTDIDADLDAGAYGVTDASADTDINA